MKKLDRQKWIPNIIENLFQVSGSYTTKPSEIIANGPTPRITCASTQNGLDDCYKNTPTEGGGVLTVDSATIGSVFFQPYNFIATDHVEKIQRESSPFSENEGLFLQTAISTSVGTKYQYGYKFSQTRIKRQNIMLPINKNGKPDYNYMSEYVGESKKKLLAKYRSFAKKQISQIEYKVIPSLYEKEWRNFLMPNVFNKIKRGKRLKKADHVSGMIPYVSSTAENNGVDDYISATKGTRVFNNCISLANSGSVGTAFFEPFDFVASDHVTSLKNDAFSKYNYLFLICILEKQKSNFNFNREINDPRIRKMQIMLPINKNNEPDFEYMEQYAKNIIIKKYNQYLKYLENNNINKY